MRILIVDDQALFREGLGALLLALRPEVELRQWSSRALREQPASPDWRPHLALVGVGAPSERLEPLRRLRQVFPDAVLVLLAGVQDDALLRPAIEAGAAGYIPCTIDPASSMSALQHVLDHGIYLGPEPLAGEHRSDTALDGVVLSSLNAQERSLLRTLLQGRWERARALAGGDEALLETACARLWGRLSVSGRLGALLRVARPGLAHLLFADLPVWHREPADAG